MKTTRRITLLLILLLSLAHGAEADKTKPKTKVDAFTCLNEAAPAYTEAEARSYVQEMIPLVEQAAGRKFKTIPQIKLTNRAGIAVVITQDMVPWYKRVYKMTKAQAVLHASSEAKHSMNRSLSMYSDRTHVLYLLPRNMTPIMDLEKIAPKDRQEILKLDIANMLSYALHEQHVNMAMLDESANTKEKFISYFFQGVGFGAFVQERVADQLHTSSANRDMARFISHSFETNLDVPYRMGHDFIVWQFSHGGFDQLWRSLAAPPVTMEQLQYPEISSDSSP